MKQLLERMEMHALIKINVKKKQNKVGESQEKVAECYTKIENYMTNDDCYFDAGGTGSLDEETIAGVRVI